MVHRPFPKKKNALKLSVPSRLTHSLSHHYRHCHGIFAFGHHAEIVADRGHIVGPNGSRNEGRVEEEEMQTTNGVTIVDPLIAIPTTGSHFIS